MRFFAALLAILALIAAPCEAAITVTNLGTQNSGSNSGTSSPFHKSISVINPAVAGAMIAVVVSIGPTRSSPAITDSGGNTYSAVLTDTIPAVGPVWMAYSANPATALPGPCTVTATETSTTLVVSSGGTCGSTATFTATQTISGGSFTGVIASPCTLVAGAATCTITGGATVGSPATATISSAITVTWLTADDAPAMNALQVTGLDLVAPLDTTAAAIGGGVTTATTPATKLSITNTAGAIVLASTFVQTNAGTFTQSTSDAFTLGNYLQQTAGGSSQSFDYRLVSSGATTLYGNQSWVNSARYGQIAWAFKAASAGTTPSPNLLLTGVGQ